MLEDHSSLGATEDPLEDGDNDTGTDATFVLLAGTLIEEAEVWITLTLAPERAVEYDGLKGIEFDTVGPLRQGALDAAPRAGVKDAFGVLVGGI